MVNGVLAFEKTTPGVPAILIESADQAEYAL
jgi:hypothetical protein